MVDKMVLHVGDLRRVYVAVTVQPITQLSCSYKDIYVQSKI